MAIRYIRSTWWGLRRTSEEVPPGERRYNLWDVPLLTRRGTHIGRQVSFPDGDTALFYWVRMDGGIDPSARIEREQINQQDLRVHRSFLTETIGFQRERFMWTLGGKER